LRKQAFSAEIDFVAPAGAPTAHQAVTVTVVYAMYDGLPLYEKHVVVWKSVFLARRFMLKESEYVPRQARDEHRERLRTKMCLQVSVDPAANVKVKVDALTTDVSENGLLRPFYGLKLSFCQDRLGTNIGKALKKRAVFLRCYTSPMKPWATGVRKRLFCAG
jgi:hypothetical protein